MRNILEKICGENLNTLSIFNNVFSKIVPFLRAGHGTDGKMAHAHCMLDN
jgi:hypothetical protein